MHMSIASLDAVRCAHDQARALGHGVTGPGHLLLGLLSAQPDELSGNSLDRVHAVLTDAGGTDAQRIRSVVAEAESVDQEARKEPHPPGYQPFRPSVAQVVELAHRAAERRGDGVVIEPDHLLLALVHEGGEAVASALAAGGAEADEVKARLLAELAIDVDAFPELRCAPPGARGLAELPDSVIEFVEVGARLAHLPEDMAAPLHRWGDFRRERESRVVRWGWATDFTGADELAPLWHERHGYGPGRFLERQPVDLSNIEQYGYDERNRIVVARGHLPTGELGEEALLLHDGSRVGRWRCSRYNMDGEWTLRTVERAHLDGGRVEMIETWFEYGPAVTRFAYEDGRLVRVLGPLGEELLSWGEDGELDSIQAKVGTETETRYRRPPRDLTLPKLLRLTEDALVERIPAAVAAHPPQESAYCLAVHYNGGEPMVPPLLVIGLVAIRDALLVEHGADPWYIWNPAEWASAVRQQGDEGRVPWLTLDDDRDFAELCRLVEQEIGRADLEHEPRALFNRVAQRLARVDWSAILPITEDFVVYAVDFQVQDLDENLRLVLPPDRLADLAARGWLDEETFG